MTSREAPVSLDEFLRLSRRLTTRASLDATIAATYLAAIVAVPANIPLLTQLVRTPNAAATPAHRALAEAIVESWYTGVYTLNGESRLATHTGALMWSVLSVPAPGVCAGAFGAWSQAPRRS